MELQIFVDTSSNYLNLLKSKKFIIRRFYKYGLYLIKYSYDNDIDTNSYEKYCRGALVEMNTNKVIFVPPSKAIESTIIEDSIDFVQELYDGTMINLIYHNNEWILFTRSDIGLNNKWNAKSFKTMLEECGSINYDALNKEYTYSFVMQHVDNRNISIINENKLILVEVRHNLNIVDMSLIKDNLNPFINSLGFIIAESLSPEKIEAYLNILNNNTINSFNWKGLTYKKDNNRYNIINPMFENVKELSTNTNNPLFNFVHLWKTDKLKEYLYYFNEYTNLFEKYKIILNICIKELYDNYVKIKIKKSKYLKDVPFQLKPLIHELHKIYLKDNNKMTYNKTQLYFKNLDAKRSTFILKYYVL